MNFPPFQKRILILLCLCAGIFHSAGCTQVLQKPEPQSFAGQNAPPAVQEFRWSNGDLPKTIDPAKSVAAPETDIVRAVFDGLTDLEGKTMKPVPAIASNWQMSDDARTWTFYLRTNARWTNGKLITAKDFVRSWQRIVEAGEKLDNSKLFSNIVGASLLEESKSKNQNIVQETQAENSEQIRNGQTAIRKQETWFGVEALDSATLRVWLVEPDKDFPALTAHPAFRPVFEDGAEFENLEFAPKIVTSGAFRVLEAGKNGVLLERNKNYWNARNVKLERVRFVPTKNAETALAAYRAGELDAVTNARFEPLAAKLLSSYEDFRRQTFNALTFYEFNRERPYLADKRVRQALALAIDRERLTGDELDGAGAPAQSFLPHLERNDFRFNPEEARRLLREAGFENGKNFPKLKLLVNRSDSQRRIARATAAQWRKNLGIETEIIVSSLPEFEKTSETGDFDLVRRSAVLPTINEFVNLQLIFAGDVDAQTSSEIVPAASPATETERQIVPRIGGIEMPQLVPNVKDLNFGGATGANEKTPILSTEEAAAELPAIPLYSPLSYSLVKPYVRGFEPNLLDAPQLKGVEIQTDWQR